MKINETLKAEILIKSSDEDLVEKIKNFCGQEIDFELVWVTIEKTDLLINSCFPSVCGWKISVYRVSELVRLDFRKKVLNLAEKLLNQMKQNFCIVVFDEQTYLISQ